MPKLVTFYNGATDIGDRVLRLSDSFPMAQNAEAADVEVCVKMINIRPQYGSDHLKNCKLLSEYSWFVEEVRRNRETMDIEPAIDYAIKDMPEDYVIRPYMIAHQAEVKNMLFTEYDEKETMELFRKEGREEGIKEGREEGSNLLAKLIRVLTPGSKDYEDALNGTYETRQELFKKYNIV
ncbi:MAG: hypothetical protein K6B44_03560 [Lachnospiraceae bacterium]|nr:hypothetical protein [Lachnospiraceae bacterium]